MCSLRLGLETACECYKNYNYKPKMQLKILSAAGFALKQINFNWSANSLDPAQTPDLGPHSLL